MAAMLRVNAWEVRGGWTHGPTQADTPSCSHHLQAVSRAQTRSRHAHQQSLRSRPTSVCCSAATSSRADPVYIQEYEALKEKLLTTTRQAGGGLAAYLLFTVDGSSAVCALIGSAASNLYLLWLFRDIDSFTGETWVAMREAEQVKDKLPRFLAKIAAGYSHALQPRLLVLVGLAAAAAAINQVFPDQALDRFHQGCLLLGFLTYKVPLILKIADDNLPKSYKADEMSRPTIERFEDELDQWGRPKKAIITMPTEALPDNIDAEALPVVDLEAMSSVKMSDVGKLMGLPGKQADGKAGAQEQQASGKS